MAKVVFDSEKELENLIFKHQDNGHCIVIDEDIHEVYQQLPLGSYGKPDIVAMQYDFSDDIVPRVKFIIFEIKKESIKTDAFAQVARYMAGLNHILSESEIGFEFEVVGVLVAPEIDRGDTVFMCDYADQIDTYLARCDLEKGISFKHTAGWHRSEIDLTESTATIIEMADEYAQSSMRRKLKGDAA